MCSSSDESAASIEAFDDEGDDKLRNDGDWDGNEADDVRKVNSVGIHKT